MFSAFTRMFATVAVFRYSKLYLQALWPVVIALTLMWLFHAEMVDYFSRLNEGTRERFTLVLGLSYVAKMMITMLLLMWAFIRVKSGTRERRQQSAQLSKPLPVRQRLLHKVERVQAKPTFPHHEALLNKLTLSSSANQIIQAKKRERQQTIIDSDAAD